MNWLLLLYFIELGYAPFYNSQNIAEEYNVRLRDAAIYYVTLNTELILFEHMFIVGAVKTYVQDQPDELSYFPFEVDYFFKIGLRYKNIELGFKHFCLHPVRPYEMYYRPQGSTDGAYEEFYIRISN